MQSVSRILLVREQRIKKFLKLALFRIRQRIGKTEVMF